MGWFDGITDSVDVNLSKPQDSEGRQRSLVCYSPWGYKDSYTTVTEQQKPRYFITF